MLRTDGGTLMLNMTLKTNKHEAREVACSVFGEWVLLDVLKGASVIGFSLKW